VRPGIASCKAGSGCEACVSMFDRIACAWMIRRFIDTDAGFKFVPPTGYCPKATNCVSTCRRRVTHQGGPLQLEVLLEWRRDKGASLIPNSEIVHDTIEDAKFGREEAPRLEDSDQRICAATK